MEKFKRASGFSMIEMVIVIVILAIISIPIYINWDKSTTSLDQQTEILASNLRYTQNLSMAKNAKCRLVITSSNTYVIQDEKGQELSIPNIDNGESARLNSEVSFVLPPTGFISAIIFDGRGVPYTDTTPISKLTTEAQITLRHLSEKNRTVRISPRTGKVSSN